MSDETKRFDPVDSDRELDELIRSTKEEIARLDALYAEPGRTEQAQLEEPVQPEAKEPPRKKEHTQEPVRHVTSTPVYEPDEEDTVERQRLPSGLKAFLYVVGVLVASALLGLGMWLCADDVCAFTKPDQEVMVTVGEHDTIDDVTDMLKENDLIRYKWLFKLYAMFAHADSKIGPGTYTLNNTFDYHALVSGMTPGYGNRATISLTVPEGYECAQIFQLLDENGVCPKEDLYEAAANYDFDYDFLLELPKGNENRLEGYLFPDTYEFYLTDKPENVLEKFLDNFERRVDEDLQAKIAPLNEMLTGKMQAAGFSSAEIEAGQMDLNKVIIVASLIEKEAALSSERATVASVIYNRLCSKDYPYLQIDATIQYILEERKETLTSEDQAIDNPYNTYQYRGLPPGAISNPGLASIEAALSPENTPYYFYALESDGAHHFSETYAQHQQFLESQNAAS